MSRRMNSGNRGSNSGDREADGNLPPELLREAVEWHVLLHSGEAQAHELEAFQQWRQDPLHANAYAELDKVWQQFDAAVPLPARQTLKAVVGESASPSSSLSPGARSPAKTSALKKVALGVGGACCALLSVLLGTLVWQANQRPDGAGGLENYLSAAYWGADYRTGIGERRVVTLTDQSTLILNTFSAVNIDYSDEQRVIQLLQGEIKIQVAKDPARPLSVATRHGSATALGTRYSVYDQGDATRVQVVESAVQVCAAAGSAGPLCERLVSGQATSVSDSGVDSPRAIDRNFEHDWLTNQLVVSDQPLSRVLDELSRYHWGMIKTDRAALRDFRVSGVFPLDDPLRALAVLEQSLPIEITRYSPLLTVVIPR